MLVQQVVSLVTERGAATVDDILPRLEGVSRAQVMQALKNARKRGLIDCDGPRGRGTGLGRSPGVYRPLAPKPARTSRRVASVWELRA